MQKRLAALIGAFFLAGCSASAAPASEETPVTLDAEQQALVGTWRWSGSGKRIGTIDLGEEHFVFRADGTYTVVSIAGDGTRECIDGTFVWRSSVVDRGHCDKAADNRGG